MNFSVGCLAIALGAASMLRGSTRACAVVQARRQRADTARIQAALNLCAPGEAVVLRAAGGETAFESAPLILPRGVTLFVDRGVTLYASKNPRDYDLAPCCKPFVYSYQAAYSGVAGGGVIDGQGVARDLISSYESQGFALTGITLRNAAGNAAAIFKTIGLRVSNVTVDSSKAGLLLSNATDAEVNDSSIRAPASLTLASSVLGPTVNVRVNRSNLAGGVSVTGDVRQVVFDAVSASGPRKGTGQVHWTGECIACQKPPAAFDLDFSAIGKPGSARSLRVKNGESIQSAIDALPVTGGDVTVEPGVYREVVAIRKPHVHLHGSAADPSKTVIVFNNGAVHNGGTFNSATLFVEADDVTIGNLSVVNDLGVGKGQAVALHVTADRAIFRHLRILAAQDTLFAASRYCYGDYGPCIPTRQYFADSFIEGNVDFIFGDSKAVFDRCELHGIPTGNVMYTAQSKHTADQDSGYVFNHCVLTGASRVRGAISLGRPWRPYASVVFLDARIDAPVIPGGWTEWPRFGVPSLPTAYYAEFHSAGPGASPSTREPYSHRLTAAEAAKWSTKAFLGWDPAR